MAAQIALRRAQQHEDEIEAEREEERRKTSEKNDGTKGFDEKVHPDSSEPHKLVKVGSESGSTSTVHMQISNEDDDDSNDFFMESDNEDALSNSESESSSDDEGNMICFNQFYFLSSFQRLFFLVFRSLFE